MTCKPSGASPGRWVVRLVRSHRGLLKRGFDVCVAGVALLLATPILAAVALAIWVCDGHPVVFGHVRLGRHGRSFRCLKLRTMRRDGDALLGELLARSPEARAEWAATRKLQDDPRVLGGSGRFLRRWSLDELPQLWNVLRGEMSLVGPRPIVADELVHYDGQAAVVLRGAAGADRALAGRRAERHRLPERGWRSTCSMRRRRASGATSGSCCGRPRPSSPAGAPIEPRGRAGDEGRAGPLLARRHARRRAGARGALRDLSRGRHLHAGARSGGDLAADRPAPHPHLVPAGARGAAALSQDAAADADGARGVRPRRLRPGGVERGGAGQGGDPAARRGACLLLPLADALHLGPGAAVPAARPGGSGGRRCGSGGRGFGSGT